MNHLDSRRTRDAETDIENIRSKWKSAFDKICDTFDAPMKHYCEKLTQQLISFQKEKTAIFAGVVNTVGEERAHMAFDEMLNDLMPSSLRRLVVLIGIDSAPVPESMSVASLQLLPSPSISESSVTNSQTADGASIPPATVCIKGTKKNGLLPIEIDVDVGAEAAYAPTQQPKHLMSSFFEPHSSSLYSVPSAKAGINVLQTLLVSEREGWRFYDVLFISEGAQC